jgi:hypothetical protein
MAPPNAGGAFIAGLLVATVIFLAVTPSSEPPSGPTRTLEIGRSPELFRDVLAPTLPHKKAPVSSAPAATPAPTPAPTPTPTTTLGRRIPQPGWITPKIVHPGELGHGDDEAFDATAPLSLEYDWKNINMDDIGSLTPEFEPPRNGKPVCELFLLAMPHICRIEHGEESMMQCIERVGGETLERALPTRCTKSSFWQEVRALGPSFASRGGKDVGRDRIHTIQTSFGPNPYIHPAERTFLRGQPYKQCADGTRIHSITFAISHGTILPRVSRRKMFDFVPYNPNLFPSWEFRQRQDRHRYNHGHQDEFDATALHKYSYFGFTHKRGGWDCMRHVEQMAAGVIPYMADIHLCGHYCLAALPKSLLKEALEMPGVSYLGALNSRIPVNREYIDPRPRVRMHLNYVKVGKIDWNVFNTSKYFDLADRVLDHTQKYLSTRSMMAYVLNAVGYEEPKHVLFFIRPQHDYLAIMAEQGLSDLGINYTVNVPNPGYHQQPAKEGGGFYTTAEFEEIRNQHGVSSQWTSHGADHNVAMRIAPEKFPHGGDEDIRNKLRAGLFDLVIYPWATNHPGEYPLWHEVSSIIPRERRIFMNGNDDDPGQPQHSPREYGHVFKRERIDEEHC